MDKRRFIVKNGMVQDLSFYSVLELFAELCNEDQHRIWTIKETEKEKRRIKHILSLLRVGEEFQCKGYEIYRWN